MADLEYTKRTRTANFMDSEVRVLIEKVTEHSETLFDRLGTTVTAKMKEKLWQEITAAVNAQGECTRNVKQIKKKWSELRGKAISIRNKEQNPQTSGVHHDDIPWWVQVVLGIIGENNTVSCRRQGGSESLVLPVGATLVVKDEPHSPESQDGIAITTSPPPPSRVSLHEETVVEEGGDESPVLPEGATLVVSYQSPTAESQDAQSTGQHSDHGRGTSASSSGLASATTTEGSGAVESGSVDRLAPLGKRHHGNEMHEAFCGSKYRKTVELVDKEINKVQMECKKLQLEVDVLTSKKTNAQIKQLILFYEAVKLQRDLNIPLNLGIGELASRLQINVPPLSDYQQT